MTDSEFLNTFPQDANPICVNTRTLTIAHNVIARALVERGYESRPCPLYVLANTIKHWISQGYHVIAVGVGEPLPYRVERIELFFKELTEPLHPAIHMISGDRCAKCKHLQAPSYQYLGRAIVSISESPANLIESHAKFLQKARAWVLKNLCTRCSAKIQSKYGPVEVCLESNAEFYARVARNYPQAFEFDDRLLRLSSADLKALIGVSNFLPEAIS